MAVLISIGTGSTGQDGRGESTSSAHAHTHTVSVRAIRKERNAGSLTVRHLRRLAALGDSRAVSYARVFRLAPRRHYLRPSLRQPLPQARVFGCGLPAVASQCASLPFPPVRSAWALASSRLVHHEWASRRQVWITLWRHLLHSAPCPSYTHRG